MSRQRVLLLYRPDCRPFMEMLADHLSRQEFDVVLDAASDGRPPSDDTALAQIEFADRVVVAFQWDTMPRGGLVKCARRAAGAGKLVLVSLSPIPGPIGETLPVVDLSTWRGSPDGLQYKLLLKWLRAELPGISETVDAVVPTPADTFYLEVHKSGSPVAGDIEGPAPTYSHKTEDPPITGRHPAEEVFRAARSQRKGEVPDAEPSSEQPVRLESDINREHLTRRFEGFVPRIESHIPDREPRPHLTYSPSLPDSDQLAAILFGQDGSSPQQAGFSSPSNKTDPLRMSVRAPNRVKSNDSFLIQVWIFKDGQSGLVRRLARKADKRAEDRGTKRVGAARRGSEFKIALEPNGLIAKETTYFETWRGTPIAAQFQVTAPESQLAFQYLPTIRVSLDGVPLARHAFVINVQAIRFTAKPKSSTFKPYRRAFLSYASADRRIVLLQAQALRAAKIEVFQDLLSLEPGDRWEKKLYNKIAEADLFLLFWSRRAADSEWVVREAEYALTCQRNSRRRLPEIVPVIIDGPPPAQPPSSLQHLHFNDPVRCIMASLEMPQLNR